MGFFSELGNFFTGSKDAKAARNAAGMVSAGETESGRIGADFAQQGMESAQNFLTPYQQQLGQQGQQANQLYGSRLGVFGPDQQASSMAGFQPSVGLNFLNKYMTDQMSQGRASAGNFRSGGTNLAAQEIFQRNMLNDYWQQMQGLSQFGNVNTGRAINIAGNQAGIAERGYGRQGDALSGAALGSAQANAGGVLGDRKARNAGMSRGIGLASTALSAYMGMPTGMGGGGNNMASVGMTPQDYNLPWRR